MDVLEKILNELMPLLVGILTLVGTLFGSWLTYRFTSKDRLKYEQAQAVKKIHALITGAEKVLVVLRVDYQLNGVLSPICKENVKTTRDRLISFYDEQSIILPENLTNKIDSYVQKFVISHASVVLSDHIGISQKSDALKTLEDDISELRNIKKILRTEFRIIIGVRK